MLVDVNILMILRSHEKKIIKIQTLNPGLGNRNQDIRFWFFTAFETSAFSIMEPTTPEFLESERLRQLHR